MPRVLPTQIAVSLMSASSYQNHITSILSNLDANARTDAVVKAIRKGLITVEKEEEL
jgi:DNA-binding NarL/FixJ family response regulator